MENNSRIPSLDGLRAISIALVVIHHTQMNLGDKGDSYGIGNLGVRIFFIISGFLITGLLLKELGNTGKVDLLRFYFRRTLRIFAPFYFFLSIMFIANLLGWIPYVPTKAFLNMATYTGNYFSNDSWDITHSWSLAVEEQFYLIFPFILALTGVAKTKKILLAVLVIAPAARLGYFWVRGETDFFWFTTAFHHNMDALATGGLLSLFYRELHANRFYQIFAKSKLPLLLIPIAIIILNAQGDHPKFGLTAAISGINLLIALFLDWSIINCESVFGKILNSRPMVLIGMMSYSIYLWQQPFFNPFNKTILTTFPYNFVPIIITVILSYYLVEKKSLELRQYLEVKLLNRDQPLAVSESV